MTCNSNLPFTPSTFAVNMTFSSGLGHILGDIQVISKAWWLGKKQCAQNGCCMLTFCPVTLSHLFSFLIILLCLSIPHHLNMSLHLFLVCILIPICDLQSAFQIDPCCPLCFSFLSQRVGEHVVPGVVVWSFSLVKVWAAWSDVSKYIESTKIMSLLASLAIPLAPAVPTVDSATR